LFLTPSRTARATRTSKFHSSNICCNSLSALLNIISMD
jgi:hypothetical protein